MPVSMNNTQVVFNDATTQTTAPVNTNANVNSVSAGTGISVSATTGALTVTNAGVTSVNGQTGAVTVSSSSGTVTSVATGNGLSGGTITTTGTLTVACPTFNTVGSYALGYLNSDNGSSTAYTVTSGTNYSAGTVRAIQSATIAADMVNGMYFAATNNLSGTWKWMGSTTALSVTYNYFGQGVSLVCRVS